ncbi:MAG: histidinol-phosphatase HisJ family protein [Epsilonproteobacteria bacterium]|nr:histidinol-phosphatase HisJ family protein [Campylobacterota bacterium]
MIDLHNHTPLCKHATGMPEEFLQKAKEQKIRIYGFSDHAPMDFDKKYRMSFEEMDSYEKMINKLKKNEDILVLLGYEVDFTPKKHLDKRIFQRNVDYLIGSVHFLDNWGFDNPEFIKEWDKRDIDDVYKEYFSYIKDLANSKLFNIIGHIDLIKVFNHKPKTPIKDLAKEAIKAIKSNALVVEVNTAGLRKPVNELYPSDEILHMLLDNNIPLTTSSDAHSPKQVGFKLRETTRKLKDMGVDKLAFFENKSINFVDIKELI